MDNILFRDYFRIYIWGDAGWQKSATDTDYARETDAIKMAELNAHAFPDDRYCVADQDKKLVWESGPKTKITQLEARWNATADFIGDSLSEVAEMIASDLEFGNEAAMLEAAEMLRLLAYQLEGLKINLSCLEDVERLQRKGINEMTDATTGSVWRTIRTGFIGSKLLDIATKISDKAIERCDVAIAQHSDLTSSK